MNVMDAYPVIAERFSFICTEQNGRYAVCDCPIRCHKNARVRFTVGDDGALLFKCMRECPKLEMLRAVGMSWKDCFPGGVMPDRPKQELVARYAYRNELKELLYETIRLEPGTRGRDKDFRQRRPKPGGGWEWSLGDVRRVLYRLPELLAAKPGAPVVVVGGEKDVETLRAVGVLATTNVCGERSEWLESYSAVLAGRSVTVIEDADSAGRRHASEVCGSLMGYAASVRRVRLPAKDATEFVMKLRALDVTAPADLRRILWENVEREAPLWVPQRVEAAA